MNNIKLLRKSKRLSQEDLGKLLSVTQTMVSKWELGTNYPSREAEDAMAKFFGVTIEQLRGDEDIPGLGVPKKNLFNEIIRIRPTRVPVLGEIAAGTPIFMNREYGSYIDLENGIKADFCLRVKGDSMINARILDGDIVFCDESIEIKNGDIAAVAIDDEITLKRFYKYTDHILLQAENPEYQPLIVNRNEGKNIQLLGKVVAFQSIVR